MSCIRLTLSSNLKTPIRGFAVGNKRSKKLIFMPSHRTITPLVTSLVLSMACSCRQSNGMNGGDAFKYLIRLVASHFKHEDRRDALTTLSTFGVPNRTTFGEFRRQHRTQSRAPRIISVCLALTRHGLWVYTGNKVDDQFSVMMPDCFPGEKRDAAEPHSDLGDMWRVTNQVTEQNGSFRSLVNLCTRKVLVVLWDVRGRCRSGFGAPRGPVANRPCGLSLSGS